MTLALLDCASACHWGARGDHRLEYLIGRATNSAYAAISLAARGYYDQALSSARTLGELANLVCLFAVDRKKVSEWKEADEGTRRKKFKAVNVRLALEANCFPEIPIGKERYQRLSVYSIHAIPDQMPQAHGPTGKAIGFPVFQAAGFIMSLNEIALPIAFIALCTGKLLNLPTQVEKTLQEITHVLSEAVGGVAIDVQGRPWFKLN
jgi:hypothetical protein